MTQQPVSQQPALPRAFFARDTVTVARDLLGSILVKTERNVTVSGRIVEVEAYLGMDDLAAHSAAGITPRTRTIFGPPGHAYVYLSYGIHECLNIVAEPEGTAGCVLIRALEPLAGIERMRARRPGILRDRDLANGPGKLTRAMGITRADNGRDLTHGGFRVETDPEPRPFHIDVTPRVGITKCVDWPLRFLIRGDPFVSRPPRHGKRARQTNTH